MVSPITPSPPRNRKADVEQCDFMPFVGEDKHGLFLANPYDDMSKATCESVGPKHTSRNMLTKFYGDEQHHLRPWTPWWDS
jgi:hypothetical protein